MLFLKLSIRCWVLPEIDFHWSTLFHLFTLWLHYDICKYVYAHLFWYFSCKRLNFDVYDQVYHQLENLSRANPPYKSIAALNCIILGCANIHDLDRAYQTFASIGDIFGLVPDIHSYNALICAFGKQGKVPKCIPPIFFFISLWCSFIECST